MVHIKNIFKKTSGEALWVSSFPQDHVELGVKTQEECTEHPGCLTLVGTRLAPSPATRIAL